MKKTFSAKPTDVTRVWHVLDASQTPLGRLSTVAARLLLGKDKPSFTHHIDVGDYVIVVNADSLIVTGNKMADKEYFRHSGFPGGLYKRTMAEMDPVKIIEHSIRGMLPVNKLRTPRLIRLKIYSGAEHNHRAQNPVKFDIKRKGAK
ncbi:50S ribosomal protein L13 [Candidatus Saccharibacteria bacterium]|nr:50S ribosomal protein L13 [Candidatus Saccharibacteria bacterium]